MLKYIISLFFTISSVFLYSQSKPIDTKPKDTVVYKQYYGLRVGVDLSRPILTLTSDDYDGFEIVGDYRLTQKLFLAAELGNETKTRQEELGASYENVSTSPLYNFTTKGNYIKLGIDYNTYANWYGEHNSIFIGARYAYANFTQTVNNYQIFNSNRYWNTDDFTTGSTTAEEYSGLSAHWLEAVLGLKVELFSNLYLGASVRVGVLLTDTDPDTSRFNNLYIPGFNNVTDNSSFGVGYNYSISYFIPLYTKAKKEKKKGKEEKRGRAEEKGREGERLPN